jgi:hypothetical protein
LSTFFHLAFVPICTTGIGNCQKCQAMSAPVQSYCDALHSILMHFTAYICCIVTPCSATQLINIHQSCLAFWCKCQSCWFAACISSLCITM